MALDRFVRIWLTSFLLNFNDRTSVIMIHFVYHVKCAQTEISKFCPFIYLSSRHKIDGEGDQKRWNYCFYEESFSYTNNSFPVLYI